MVLKLQRYTIKLGKIGLNVIMPINVKLEFKIILPNQIIKIIVNHFNLQDQTYRQIVSTH